MTSRKLKFNDSTSSSDAGDILIRSTRVGLQEQNGRIQRTTQESNVTSISSLGSQHIKISVRKLDDFFQPSSNDETSNSGSVGHPLVSEDLRASKQPVLSKEIRMQAVRKESPVPRRHEIPEVQTHVSQAGGSGHKAARPDVVISTYAPGGKEAVRAAMKQRSQSAPVKRQVKVKLLDQSAALTPELQSGQQPQPSQVWLPATENQHAATTAAAVTAAAIAATAPIMKAQSDMEAMMARVASELRRLQEMGSGGGRVQEGGASERVAQLEQQLSALTQQRLQHLELIQNQQLELQNRLMGSALDVVTGRALALAQRPQPVSAPPVMVNTPQTKNNPSVDKYTSDKAFRASGSQLEDQRGKSRSPLETPAPRKVIPKPVRWNSGVQPPNHHAPKASKQSRPEKGNGRLLEDILNNQRSPGRSTRSVGGKQVAMATAEHQTDKNRVDQSRHDRTSPGSSPADLGELSGRRPQDVQPRLGGTAEPGRLSGAEAAEGSSSAVKKANEMLQDLGRLKSEMQTLLQAHDAFPVERSRSTLNSAPAPAPAPAPAATPPPPAAVSMRPQGASAVFMPTAVPLSRPSLLQKHPAPPSMFEDAGRVLREVRHSRKVLEDNLEALLRARDADALHWQLEALANNRDASEELRIRRTVDAWINTLNKEIQDELVREEVERERSREAAQQASGEGKAVAAGSSDPRPGAKRGPQAAASKRPLHRSTRGQENRQPPNKQALPSSSAHTTQQQQPEQKPHAIREVDVRVDRRDDEEFLSKIYGKALYEGHRRTLKKGPYLRFSSPSPQSKAQRPKVIESVRGVKMKSSKTQTSLEPVPAPVASEPRFLFTPTGPADQQDPASPMQGYLIPMAIPLGQPRVDGRAPQPSRVVISDKPVTVTTSYTPAPAPPKAAPVPRKPNVVLLEVRSDQARRPPPRLQVQVQPSVNIDSVSLSSLSSAASPSPLPPPSSLPLPLRPLPPDSQTAEGKQPLRVEDERREDEKEEEDDDDDVFPGTNFLAVADIAQELDEDAVLPDAPIELEGQATPGAPLYHGPAFPPIPPQPLPLTAPILATIHQRESIENRLVDWVEQQVMARVITEMFARRAQGDPTDQPEPAESEASETGAVASALGLQLFLDDGRPVAPAVLRHYVEETLAEVISSMLGEREVHAHTAEPAAPSARQQPAAPEEAVVPTPVPTPEPSVRRSPLSRSHTQSPLDTPQASEQSSPEQTPREAEPQLTAAEAEQPPVATPTTTPVQSPPRVTTPSPPPPAPELASLRNNPWGDAELPLKEEQPHSEKEEPAQPTPVIMSVAREEEAILPSPPPSPPAKPQTPVPPPAAATVVREPSPPPPAPASPLSPSSTEESSSGGSLTETEAVARHISEGELLLSYSHIAAARALEEEGLILPNLNASLSSSLLGVQDMDYDPPSEGQVVLRPHPRSQHDPILALLARMDRGPVTQQPAERSWEEGSSAGEVSEGQRPLLPAEGESMMSGHSLLEPSHTHRVTLTSPGQLTEAAGEAGLLSTDGGFGASPTGPHTQTSRPGAPPPPSRASTARAPSPPAGLPPSLEEAPDPFVEPSHRPAPILVRQYEQRAPRDSHRPDPYHQNGHQDLDDFFEDRVNGEQAGQQEAGAVKVMSVHLPSAPLEENSASISTVEGDTDSSANDIF
ncbi:protein TALPID3 isoform X3 [Alosa sapidissima]|uniref:protein TALPID3 isoform X3 n=1 Tax=Alosa sapidissima TaxID=34773 RepID=UPI001C0A63F4|nr:protein TALPID3 isoform X3 [Alosa sapidissima]